MKLLNEEEAEKEIISLLRKRGKMKTTDIEKFMRGKAQRCPDSAVRFLMKLKMDGKIKGELDRDARAWVWWVENHLNSQ